MARHEARWEDLAQAARRLQIEFDFWIDEVRFLFGRLGRLGRRGGWGRAGGGQRAASVSHFCRE
jgi:hypothetical protein